MIKVWIYAIVLVLLAAIGLALGSGNGEIVTFDYLLGKARMPVSSVLVIGVVFGMACGFYLSMLFCWRYWRQARSARSELKAAKKSAAAAADQAAKAQKG
jgi:uncharacterized membrane protein YciS (DUF1049 family)